MALRRPAAHHRRAPGWRRSGDEIYWGELSLPRVSQTPPRPQSAIEGGQLDAWLEHLQSEAGPPPGNLPFTGLDGEPVRRRLSYPSLSAASSSCGSWSVCESSPSSQDSLQAGCCWPPSERRGSWERARITRPPKKEQTQLSYLAPVKIGWLPIQRRVMMVANTCSQKGLDDSAGHVKLKEPITPTFKKNEETPGVQDAAARRGHTGPSSLGVKMWWTPDRGAADSKEVPDKLRFPAEEGGRHVGWQALKTGWRANGVSALSGGNKFNELTTKTSVDPNKTPSLRKPTRTEPLNKQSPSHCTTSTDPFDHQTLLRGPSAADTHKSYTPLQRKSTAQPMKATAFYGSSNSSESSRANSTTLIPQNKAGISSITITSRKVSRSASLPGYNSSSKSPSPPLDHQPEDPTSSQVSVERKAMIVKMIEKRMVSSTSGSSSRPGTPPANHALDTVVRRRKATIIKVTEQKESYSPARIATRHPEYRHSYTDGLRPDIRTWNQKNGSEDNTAFPYHHFNSASNTITPSAKTYGMHRSSLNLFVSSPPTSPEVSTKAVGQRSDRRQRPLSCYGSLTGHVEASKENGAQSAARKWSFGPPQETHINPANFNNGFISPGKAAKEAGQPAADALNPSRDEKETRPSSVDGTRRASPSLTLIKAPDPHQSQEEVLALNAAAIIANIKLQRQLSKKKTPSSHPERDSAASPRGNTVMDERKYLKSNSDQGQVHQLKKPETSPGPISLQREAVGPQRGTGLKNQRAGAADVQTGLHPSLPEQSAGAGTEEAEEEGKADGFGGGWTEEGTKSTSVNGNLFTPRDRGLSQKGMQPGAASLRQQTSLLDQ